MSRRSKALRYYRSSRPISPFRLFIRRLLKLLLLLFLFYHLIFFFFLRTYRVDSESMEPSITEGETVVATPLLFGPSLPFVSHTLPTLRSHRRGDLVVVDTRDFSSSRYMNVLDTLVRFFSLQRISLLQNSSSTEMPPERIKRIIGVPGDTVKMEDFRIQIRTKGKTVFLDEYEIVQREYELKLPENVRQTSLHFPFSGTMKEIVLEEGEYLTLSDDRIFDASSHTWRPTPKDSVVALVLFHFHSPF